MRFLIVAVLSVSWLGLGCNLFSESGHGSPGKNAPIMYGGAGPGSGGLGGIGAGGAGASATPSDAAVVGSDGAAGNSARGDAGPETAITTVPDVGKPPVDADIHNDAQRWIRFDSTKSFAKCTWFSATDGFCSAAPRSIPDIPVLLVDLYKTTDGGKTWGLVSQINTETSAFDASINVYVNSPSDMWFISGLAGVGQSGQSGSIGHSTDGGKSWASLTSTVSAYLRTTSGDGGIPSIPLWQLAAVGGKVWLLPQGGNLGVSLDGGVTWKKVPPPQDFAAASNRSLIATQNTLLLRFLKTDTSLGLYRVSDLTFVPVEGVLPPSSAGDQSGTWWRSSPNVEGVLFVDRGPLPAWASPFWAYATVDGGQTFQQISAGKIGTSSDVIGLSDGLAFGAPGTVTAYASGVFAGDGSNRYLEIRRTRDAGKTWLTLHSEPYLSNYAYISVAVDPMGTVHAMHYTTDNLGTTVSYDAHYVLP